MPLTVKQQRFVAEYLIDLNATQAAIRTGYSPKTASSQGERLLRNAEISKEIASSTARHLETLDLTAQKVKERIALLAFQDVRIFFDKDGNLLPIHSLNDQAAAVIASFEVIKKNAEAGDGRIDVVHKIKTVDATKNLEMLAKHFGLLIEKVEHSGGILIKHEVPE